MNSKFTPFIQFRWIFLLVAITLVISCGDDDNMEEGLPTITQVNFSTPTASIREDASTPLTVELSLSQPLEASGSAIISVDNSSTASEADFSTDPAVSEGTIVLDLEVGATSATFMVTPVDNEMINEDKTIVFRLTDAKKGLELAKTNLTMTITVANDDELQGTISTSVSELEDFGELENGATSGSKSYTVSGTDLVADIQVESPDNFQISLDDESFSSSLIIPVAIANASPVTVYVQFVPTTGTEQLITGGIIHSATGTTDVSVAVSGSETGGEPPVELIFSDNFDYGPTAGDITSISSWENYSGTTEFIQYTPNGLTFSGYAGTGGGAFNIVNGAGSREDITKAFTSQITSGTIYTAQLVNVSSASDGDFFTSLREGGGYFNRLYVKDDGSGNLLFGTARTRSSEGVEVYTTTSYSYNTTYLVVIKYDFDTKVTSLFVISGTIPATEPATPDAVANTGSEPVHFDDIIYRQSSDNIAATVGGIRIGITWESVLGL